MEINIFDVTHGFCSSLEADNRNIMLFDCGHNESTGFRPSRYLSQIGCSGIEHLIIHNFDQDHISDISNIIRLFPIEVLYRNKSISPESLENLKLQGGSLTDAMHDAISLHSKYVHDVTNPPVFPDIQFRTFYNSYPEFTDTNNLSLVAFLFYNDVGIVFPGDLEKAGWQSLLQQTVFQNCLASTNIFIASHHGRESGYCEEVFDYCKPDIVIISDKEIVHETQKNNYAKHARGINWNGGSERRYVLTTRSDGNLNISINGNQGFHIKTGR